VAADKEENKDTILLAASSSLIDFLVSFSLRTQPQHLAPEMTRNPVKWWKDYGEGVRLVQVRFVAEFITPMSRQRAFFCVCA